MAKKKESKIYSSVTTQIVENGVLKDEKTENKIKTISKEPPFVKLYLDDIIHFFNLPKGVTGEVLMFLAQHMSYNNMICVIKPLKQIMAKQFNVGIDSINRTLQDLKKAGVIHSIDRSLYLIDPHLFAKGNWNEIKNLRLVIEYDHDKRMRKLSSNAAQELKQLQFSFENEEEVHILKDEPITALKPSKDFE